MGYFLRIFLIITVTGSLFAEAIPLKGANGKVISFDGVKEATPYSLIARVKPDGPELALAWEKFDLKALAVSHPKIHAAREAAIAGDETRPLFLGSYKRPMANVIIAEVLEKVDYHDDAKYSPKAELMNLPAYLYQADPDQLPLPFRFHQPDREFKEGDDRFPLVVWLHGSGAGGNDNLKGVYFPLMEKLVGTVGEKKEVCFVLCPQFQHKYNWWTQAPGTDAQVPGLAGAHTCELIDEICQKLPVDPERIYLVGVSQGGFAQSIWISTYENRFAASVRFAGANPSQWLHEGNLVPSWFFYSKDDTIIMNNNTMPRAVAEHQEFAPDKTKVTIYEDAGHGGTLHRGVEEEGWIEWMFQQRNPRKPTRVDRLWKYYFLGEPWRG